MHWAAKTKRITLITTDVEVGLLRQALARQPYNTRVFSKLIQALIYENKIDPAIELCYSHLDTNTQARIDLLSLYKKQGDHKSIISIAKETPTHALSQGVEIHLAHAYAQTGQLDEARQIILNLHNYAELRLTDLRLVLTVLISIDEPEKVEQIFQSLPAATQLDSDLKLSYLRAMFALHRSAEVKKLINYDTMVKRYYLPDLDKGTDFFAVNRQLADFFKCHPKQQYEPSNHATRRAMRLHLETDWNESLPTIEQYIKGAVQDFVAGSKIDIESPVELQMWATTMGEGGHQISHIHPNGILSGVYYVQTCSNPTKQQTQNSNDSDESAMAGDLIFTQAETTEQCIIEPREGLLLVFPSYFYHKTIPVIGEDQRISIAFDVVRSQVGSAR